jgi:hypothetical protein
MFRSQKVNPYWEALREHSKLARGVFLLIIVGCAVVAFATQQYSASVVLAMNPEFSSPGHGQKSASQLAWAGLTDRQVAAVIAQFYLARLQGRDSRTDPIADLRSKISIEELQTPGTEPKQVRISYTARSSTTAVNVANALAQRVAETSASLRSPGSATSISKELDDSRAELQRLAATQDRRSAEDALAIDVQAGKQLGAAMAKSIDVLSTLRLASTQKLLAASKAQFPAPSPTKQSTPGVQQEIGDLDAGRDEKEIAREEDQERALQLRLLKAIQQNDADAELQRKRLSDANLFAKAYALEQQRYATLLKEQQSAAAPNPLAGSHSARMFVVIENASNAIPIGFLERPLYWFLSAVAAILVAALCVLLAERLSVSTGKAIPVRGQ